jgi:predicted ATPase
MALISLLFGFPDEAERNFERALAREKELGHPVTTAWVLSVGLVHAMLIDDRNLIDALSARMSEHSQKFKMTHFHRLARFNIAYLAALKGDPEAGLAEIDTCLSEWLGAGYRYFIPIVWLAQIRIQLLFEKIDDAFETVKLALAHVAETGEAIFAAEVHRMNGIIALADKSERNEQLAEQAFQTAIEVARAQDAKLLELRAATSLARLWRDNGKRAEAETLLAPIYNWFTEGFGTPDLMEAKALLDELATSMHAAH